MKGPGLLTDVRLCLALGAGAGLFPKAPGTAGSLAAIPLYYLAAWLLPPDGVVLAAVLLLAVGPALCAHAQRRLNSADDRRIVWDEIAAFFLILVLLPPAWQWQAVAFVLFRFFDAVKPFPINWLDKRVGGGIGVMVDDIAAAAMTLLIVYPLYYYLGA